MTKGTITHYDEEKLFGFVKIDEWPNEDLFFHKFGSKEMDVVEIGKQVSFEVIKNKNKPGRLVAINLKYI